MRSTLLIAGIIAMGSVAVTMADEAAVSARVAQALELYKQGPSRAPEIIRLLSEEIEHNPANEDAVRLLAITYFGVGQFERAVATFDQAIALAAKRDAVAPEMLFYKASALFELNRCQQAKAMLDANRAFWLDDLTMKQQYERLNARVTEKCGQP